MSPFVRVETEHCADILDVASNVTQTYVDSQAAMASALSAPEQTQNADGSWPITECVDCDCDLGERLALGKVRCLRCQEVLEKRRRGYGVL